MNRVVTRMRIFCMLASCSVLLGACASEVASDEYATESLSDCAPFTATNATHVSQGRAYTRTERVSYFTVTTYYANGTNENLGRSGLTRTTLYRISDASYSRTTSACSGNDAGAADSGVSDASVRYDASVSTDASLPSSDASAPSAGSAGCGLPPASNGARTITVGTTSRTYVLAAPSGYDARRAYPLVLAFHGAGSSGSQAQLYFGLQRAVANQAIVVYPDALANASGTRAWGTYGTTANTDIAFVDALIGELERSLCVDSTRIFAMGHSSGGYFSNTLGCARGNRLRAIASVAGGGPFVSCDAGQVAAWIETSSDDTVVPTSAGQASRDHWVAKNHCSQATRAVGPSSCVQYEGCDVGHPVNFCQETSLGHGWPSYAGSAIWTFFSTL